MTKQQITQNDVVAVALFAMVIAWLGMGCITHNEYVQNKVLFAKGAQSVCQTNSAGSSAARAIEAVDFGRDNDQSRAAEMDTAATLSNLQNAKNAVQDASPGQGVDGTGSAESAASPTIDDTDTATLTTP